jgi:hypothetical protein
MVCADHEVSLLGESIHTTKKNTESLLDDNKQIGLEAMCCKENAGYYHDINIGNKPYESLSKFE